MTHELLGQLALRNESFQDNPVSVEQMGELIDMVQRGDITGKDSVDFHSGLLNILTTMRPGTSGKVLLRHMLDHRTAVMPSKLAAELSLLALSGKDDGSLERLCRDAMAAMPSEVAAVRGGNTNVLNKIVGRVMKASRGRADALATKTLLEKLVRTT